MIDTPPLRMDGRRHDCLASLVYRALRRKRAWRACTMSFSLSSPPGNGGSLHLTHQASTCNSTSPVHTRKVRVFSRHSPRWRGKVEGGKHRTETLRPASNEGSIEMLTSPSFRVLTIGSRSMPDRLDHRYVRPLSISFAYLDT